MRRSQVRSPIGAAVNRLAKEAGKVAESVTAHVRHIATQVRQVPSRVTSFRYRKRSVDNDHQAEITPTRAIHAAVSADDIAAIDSILEQHPDLLHYGSINHASLLSWAAKHSSYKAAVYLIDAGVDVDRMTEKGTGSALSSALNNQDLRMMKLLLDSGANPNIERTLFSAIRCEDEDVGLAAAQSLVEHGVDVNHQFEWFGSKELTVTPLEFAEMRHKSRIAEFLRSAGAKPR